MFDEQRDIDTLFCRRSSAAMTGSTSAILNRGCVVLGSPHKKPNARNDSAVSVQLLRATYTRAVSSEL